MTVDEQTTHAELLEQTRSADEAGVAAREELIGRLEAERDQLLAQNQELRETQRRLEEERARYVDLYDFAPAAYLTFDVNGCIVELNLAAAALLGSERERLLGQPFLLFVAAADKQRFLSYLTGCFTRSDKPTLELTLAPRTRGPLVVQLVSTLCSKGCGNRVGCRVVLTDLSERLQTEEALRFSVRMREDFLAIVSHDLRSPLNSILLGTQTLLKAMAGSDEQPRDGRNVLHIIKRSAERMSHLLADLLDLSSMSAGHLSMQRAPQDVAELVTAALELVRPAVVEKGLQLDLQVEADKLLSYCDRERITQLLLNLLGNAIKYTPRGGSIRVVAKPQTSGVQVAVHDTGPGIEKTQLAHIFDPYWQAGKTAHKGAGLGLSIAKGIVEFHGGKLWAESEPGQGSSFYFTLPSAPPPDPSDSPSPEPTSDSGPTPLPGPRAPKSGSLPAIASPAQPTILLVDDEDDVRTHLAELLTAQGYHVATAANGSDALGYLRKGADRPFVILLDLEMPVLDGWQFLTLRCDDPALAEIPVVLISGQSAAPATAALLGLSGFIQKPIAIAKLIQLIEQLAR
ncbi:MAG TPA: ATP-binding protein [Pseudomonadota bacterium]|nr:ATP-binding protein [Pseudomonadota bacterium]